MMRRRPKRRPCEIRNLHPKPNREQNILNEKMYLFMSNSATTAAELKGELYYKLDSEPETLHNK